MEKRREAKLWGLLEVGLMFLPLKGTSLLRIDYVTSDTYSGHSQAFTEVWGGCERDLITEVGIIGT